MKMSAQGIQGLKRFEGLELSAYPDLSSDLGKVCKAKGLRMRSYTKVDGWQKMDGKPWTIGYGWTGKVDGKPIVPGMVITQAQADALLPEQLASYEEGVTKMVKVPLTQGQFDALVSFAWNFGVNRLKQSRLMNYLNAGAYGAAAGQFKMWVKAGGVVEDGLVSRRKQEENWFTGTVAA